MPAPKGNQFWKHRSKAGRDRIFSSPDQLLAAAGEYFQWLEDNPVYSAELVKYKGSATVKQVPKMRMPTVEGLCRHLHITTSTWYDYKANDALSVAMEQIDEAIREARHTGAAADLLNAGFVAKIEGLSDRIDHVSSDRSMSPTSVDRETVAALIDKLTD